VVTTAASCWAVSLPLSGGVGLEAAGLPVEVAEGGGVGVDLVGAGASGASFAGAELAGSEESGAVLEGEELASFFFFFFGAVGAKGSTLPASSVVGASVAGAGVLGLWRGDEVLLRAVVWRCRGRAPRTCGASQRGGRKVAGTRWCRAWLRS
jgi:hypothetical protein